MGISFDASIVDARVAGEVRGPDLPRTESAHRNPEVRGGINKFVNEIHGFMWTNPIVATATAAIPGGLAALAARKLGANLPLTIAAGTVLGAIGCVVGAKVHGVQHDLQIDTKNVTLSPPSPNSPPRHVKVLSYNVRSMMGPDKHRPTDKDFARVAKAILAEDPDIVLLQETSTFGAATNFADQVSKLASYLNPNSVASASSEVRSTGSTDENVVMTFNNFGISDARGIRLPTGGQTQRGVADTMIVTPEGVPIRVLSTHLSFDNSYLNELEALKRELASSNDTPTIVGGDFNQTSESPNGKRERLGFNALGLADALGVLGKVNANTTTFPSRAGSDIDRIYGSHLRVVDAHIVTSADNVSDHRPVVAEFFVPSQREG